MTDAPQQPEVQTKKAASPPILMIGVVVGALAAGAVLGGFVVAPHLTAGRVAAKPAGHAADAESEAESASEDGEKDGKEGKDGKHGEKKRAAVFRLENLIVNPSGSQGTRFLMTTVAFEVPDEKVEGRLRDHEIQVRDAVMTSLESQTLEMLTAPGSRDRLKQQLAKVVEPIAGSTRVRVYLPQFVIQ